jgi:starch-binding outer membrane protein, SusD/RagB family
MRPSHYFYEKIWEKSGYNEDIRNSEFNIVRDFIVNNPASDHNGKWVFKDNVPIALSSLDDTTRNYFPVVAKASTPGKHPSELYHADQTVPGSLTNNAQPTFRDQYAMRLAETYLLRAEAYLGNNNKVKAAEDINVVRRRANAPEIDASMVDIDYILDERLRELHFEELRLVTLARLGKVVERTKKFNPWVGDSYSSHHNLWPIPYDDIEKNIEAELKQNPGY